MGDLTSALLEISRRYGGDSAFVVAGGGNTSRKTAERLWVKASGHALATIDEGGFVELDRAKLQAMLNDRWPGETAAREALFLERVMAARVDPARGQRPSVEALLHHLLPDPLVLHTHPGVVNAVTCCLDGERLTQNWFGDEVLWMPYVDPGLLLAQALRENLEQFIGRHGTSPRAIFLQNHGLIVAGPSAGVIDVTSEWIVDRIRQKLVKIPLDSLPGAQGLPELAAAIRVKLPSVTTSMSSAGGLKWVARSPEGKAAVLAGPLTPDQIVYCRSEPLWIEPGDAASLRRQFDDGRRKYHTEHGFEPWVAVLRDSGVVAFRESSKLAETTLAVFADAAAVYRDATRLGGVRPMATAHRRFIEQWEVEAYRRSVAAAAQPSR